MTQPAPTLAPSPPGRPGEPPRHRLTYQPALDGVRAAAVLVVMLYHSGPTWFTAGFLGVDVFLVLSGFLITLLLVQEIEGTGTVDRRAFWGRRARRLLPAVFAVLVAVALYAAFAATASERETIRGDGLASLFYVQNWHLIFVEQSYFAQFGTPSPLRHMWSLAIEEQWYVIWPLLFLGLYRLTRSRLARVAAITAGLAAVSAVLMIALHDPNRDPSRVYYGTDTRAQALLVGALMAFLWAWRPPGATRAARVALNAAGVLGGAYLAWAMLTMNDGTRSLYSGGFSLVAVASAGVIAAAMTPGPIRWVLGLRPIAAIGIISYGLYLWHWPLYVFLSAERTGVHERALLLLRVGVTFAVAIASYFLLERPVRRQEWSWARRPGTWIPAGVAIVVATTLLATASIFPAQSEADAAGLTEEQLQRYAKAVREEERPPDDKTRVLVAGDSVAFTLGFWGLPEDHQDGLWLAGAAILGCGLARGALVSDGVRKAQPKQCARWPQRYEQRIESRDPDVAVLLVGAWEIYDRIVDGKKIEFGTPAMARRLERDLDEARRILTRNGAHLVLLTTPCYSPEEQEFNTWGEKERTEGWRVDWLNRLYRRYAARHPDVSVVDLHGEVCPVGDYAEKIRGREVRSDGVHFAKSGSRLVWEWLAPIVEQIAAAHPRERQVTSTRPTEPAPAGQTG